MAPTGACWICGAEAWDRVWSDPLDLSDLARFGPYAHAGHPPSWVVRCRACGFGQPECLPAVADYFEVLYERPWPPEALETDFAHPYRDLVYRGVLGGLRRHRGPGVPATLLDVGAHTGRFLHLARRDGWDAEGVELNAVTAAFAARRTGAPVHVLPAQDLADRGRRYGAVTLNDVLEHIPRPAALVARLGDLLAPGGVLAIKVPHGPMQRLKEGVRRRLRGPDWRRHHVGVMVRYAHVNHFTVGSLRRCLHGAGFRRVVIVAGAPELLPRSWPGRTGAQAASALLRHATYAAARLLPGGVHTPLAMNLQAFAIRAVDGGRWTVDGGRSEKSRGVLTR
jgi:SAM-dependent methyltransferase